MEMIFRVLVSLIIGTSFLILMMHVAGRMFGIDFGPLKEGVMKVMIFLLATSIIEWYLKGTSIFINFVIWTAGFKIAFNLDWTELFIFNIAYTTGYFILMVVLFGILAA